MKIQDEKSQIREKLAIIDKAQKDTKFRLELARKKYNRLNNYTWCNMSSLRMAEADYDYHKSVLQLIDEYSIHLSDKL